ncbi:hypothetical protein M885DRAFT_552894 [Pelagophyceae sp. CCMP2097]|nr:hypothetical protein M885DRAFT_552894 [Pelagophyceae sp. CCMP2097]
MASFAGGAAAPGTAAPDAKLAAILGYLELGSDEHVVAGLLLLSKQDAASLQTCAEAVAQKLHETKFLQRLLVTIDAGEEDLDDETATNDGASLSAAQRAGVAVTTQLARSSLPAGRLLAETALGPMLKALARAADARTLWARARGAGAVDDAADLAAVVECAVVLGTAVRDDADFVAKVLADGALTNPSASLVILQCARRPPPPGADGAAEATDGAADATDGGAAPTDGGGADDDEAASAARAADDALSELLALSLDAFGPAAPADLVSLVTAADAAKLCGDFDRELALLESAGLGLASARGTGGAPSTAAAHARRRAENALHDAIPRYLINGAAPEEVRDRALRLAALAARVFQPGSSFFADESGTVLRVVARTVAAEARLGLDEAAALVADSRAAGAFGEHRLARVARLVPLCLQLLETIVDALVGDDAPAGDDDDSDDDELEPGVSPLAAAVNPDAILDVRHALADAADAAMGFVAEARLLRDKQALPEGAGEHADVPAALGLARDCFRFLGRVAIDEDDEDDEDDARPADDDAEVERTSLHKRLADFRPFVNDLIDMDSQEA